MKNNNVSLSFTLKWKDKNVHHTCTQYFAKANLWRDILPIQITDAFNDPQQGLEAHGEITAGESFEPFDNALVKTVRKNQFIKSPHPGIEITPRLGRFYPRNFIRNETLITSEDRRPMRVVAIDDETLDIDLNSPLSKSPIFATARIDKLLAPTQEHGGRCNDFIYDMLQSGVGLQSCMNTDANSTVDYFSGDPFKRLDESDDAVFYTKPRIVQHLDATAREHIERIYKSNLQPGIKVLDLMSSWVSHLPSTLDLQVTGLGMNTDELKKNDILTKHVIHDLNTTPILPFNDNSYDVVVCTASVEYLIRPIKVFTEVARCLKSGGKFIVTFSDRWFPPKAIQLWSELHPFERVGLVSEYFKQTGLFSDVETLSIQHYPRPADDKYSDSMLYSDPVFAVWAKAQGPSQPPTLRPE